MAKNDGVQVRILVDYRVDEDTFYPVNSVPVLDPAVAKQLVAAGVADNTPEAVAYAATLPQNQAPAKAAK